MKNMILASCFVLMSLFFCGISSGDNGSGSESAYSFGWDKYEMFDHLHGKIYKITKNYTPGQLVEIDFVNGAVRVVRKFTTEEWDLIKN